MSWQGIQGHDDLVDYFRRALARGRLASSFLFVGPEGIGKRTFAVKFVQALLCQQRKETALDPCGVCPSCAQVMAGTHPDLSLVSKPEGKSEIPLSLLIGDREHRREEGLCHELALKPQYGGRKAAIIDDADYLNEEGANALLKILEEPPPKSLLILIGTTPVKQLPTVRSRCQLIRFRPLPENVVAEILLSQGLVRNAAEAQHLARHSGGSVRRAMELNNPELWAFRRSFLQQLSRPTWDFLSLAREAAQFVEQAGKEAAERRMRLRTIIEFAVEFFQCLLHTYYGREPGNMIGDKELQTLARKALENGDYDDETIIARLERSLDALAQLERNVNQTTLLECWLDDLVSGCRPL